jgi:hypothetical protein
MIAVLPGACHGNPETPSAPKALESQPPQSTIQIQTIHWPTADRIDHAVLERLPEAARRRTAQSTLPVLVPRDPALLAHATIMTEEYYFAFSSRADGISIAIQGTRLAHQYESIPKITGDRTVRGVKGFVTVNEGVREASWIENGASYTLDVECTAAEDERCSDDRFVLQTAQDLAFVGGRSGEQP